MKAAPTAMKALRCPELPTARKTTPMARTTAPGARDLAGELLGASVMRRTAQSSAARASASAAARCWADVLPISPKHPKECQNASQEDQSEHGANEVDRQARCEDERSAYAGLL